MTTNDRRRGRRLVLGLLAVLALVGLAAAAQGQQRVYGDVLGNESSPIGFTNVEDTLVQESAERPADRRAEATNVALRGNDTVSGPTEDLGRQDYLSSLSASGAVGIDDQVVQRYRNGQVEDARLQIAYNGGCNSPNGQLTVRAIETRSWSPFNIVWNDTTRAGDGTVAVQGPLLAQAEVSPNAAQENPNIGCNQATLPLETEPLSRVLEGELGGLSMFWTGEQELNVSTVNADNPPRLELNVTTHGPQVHEVSIDGEFPAIVDTGERLTVAVNATDAQTLPDDGVTIDVDPESGEGYHRSLDAKRSGDAFVATQTFPVDAEGRYELTARATDTDGWIDEAPPEAPGPHIVADGTAPNVSVPTLAGQPAGEPVTSDQDQTIELSANVSDLSCTAVSPCGDWKLVWRGQTLAEGPLDDRQRIEADVFLPRPGNTTARLVVQDAAGHENASIAWPLEVADTHPPEARALEDSHLAPGRGTTLENGTTVDVRFQIDDALPVDAKLLLEGTQAIERGLPEPDERGRVLAELDDVPEGTYEVRVVLDDGTNTKALAFGELTIAPEGAPSVSVDVTGSRIGPDDAIEASVRDRDLNGERTSVRAKVNGLSVQPDIETEPVDGGQDVTVHLGDLEHGDEVQLTVRAHDNQGLNATGRAAFTVDAEAPTLSRPEPTTWVRPGQTVRFDAEDPGDGQAEITVEGSARTTGPTPATIAVDKLTADTGRLTSVDVTLRDDLGNERTRTIEVGVDEAPPVANTTFTRDGLVVVAEDAASGVLRVDAALGVNGEPLNQTQVFQESPTRFFVTTGPLTRGDEIQLAAQVRDEVGHKTPLGTRGDPLELTVPDRAPTIELERTSPIVGADGQLNWTAEDPDQDALDVTLRVEGPSGDVSEEPVDALGSKTITPEQPGRYTVTVEAASAQETTTASTFFYLGPGGRLTETVSVPEETDPGSPFTVELSFPGEPQQVFVTAVDEANASTSARVELDGSRATATFDELPEGDYDLRATVVYEEGATENVHVASVQSQEPIGDQLGNLVVPILVVLAIALIVAIAAVWYKRRQEEDEEAESAERGPA